MITIHTKTTYITLQQALKLSGMIDSGGSAKVILQDNKVFVNGIHEQRRGRKLYPGDLISVFNQTILIAESEHED
ncbi:RNA-binding S4 domain-containing protein [Sulfoacidibacillus thermotolerans]|uniref:Uncharacterized protein n=1 Tax=Sulfoacidibacillus thermotolerans TaxID=1765684 RepID=A0A2U3D6A4_SULT2|nr:RNA-binding S4 domain-containing protein [Sulfoacidibacillus thermotolerans]PWI56806.1 hypothetical protein BM613_11665 [Sulfoacidibacillus thermotolerans]